MIRAIAPGIISGDKAPTKANATLTPTKIPSMIPICSHVTAAETKAKRPKPTPNKINEIPIIAKENAPSSMYPLNSPAIATAAGIRTKEATIAKSI